MKNPFEIMCAFLSQTALLVNTYPVVAAALFLTYAMLIWSIIRPHRQ